MKTRAMPEQRRRRLSIAASLAALTAAFAVMNAAQASESTYPNQPTRLVVGFTPGGTTDMLARLLATKIAESTGQAWIVENRGGAGGNLATGAVSRAAPDGYTVLFALDTQLTANPNLYKLPFNVETDLQPVTLLAKFENVLFVNRDLPVNSVNELVELAKKSPDTLNYASSGVGGTLHLATEMFKHRAGIEIGHVPYKGAAPAFTSILSGETQVMIGAIPSTLPYITSNQVRPLATTGLKRSPLVPDVPTISEAGYPDFESIGWFALAVPAGTPATIIEKIRSEALKALEDPEVRTAMEKRGLEPMTGTPEEMAQRIRNEHALIKEVVERVGIRPE